MKQIIALTVSNVNLLLNYGTKYNTDVYETNDL